MTIMMAPVISDRVIYDKKYWKNIHGVDLSHWTDNSLFKTKSILISYAYCRKEFFAIRDINNVKEFLDVSKDVLVIGDSGGFSAFTKGINIDPKDLAAWANNSVDVLASLDVPYTKGKEVIDISIVEQHAKRSRNLTEKQLKDLSDEVEFMPVLHGRNEREIQVWWDIAVKPFLEVSDGIFLAPDNIDYAVFQLEWVRRFTDVRKIHVLGFNYPSLYFVKLYEKFFDRITFDSSTHHKNSENATFMLPFTLKKLVMGQRHQGGRKRYIIESPPTWRLCDCNVCRFFEERFSITRLYMPDDFTSFHALSLHNCYVLQHFFDISNQLLFKSNLKYLHKNVKKRVNEAIMYIESKEFPPKTHSTLGDVV